MCPPQVCGHGFTAGDLGPGTILGSAAFNTFVIVGVCVLVVPDGEVRRIRRLGVYLLTASCGVIAYVWLYLILAVFSPGVVEVLLMLAPLEEGGVMAAVSTGVGGDAHPPLLPALRPAGLDGRPATAPLPAPAPASSGARHGGRSGGRSPGQRRASPAEH